MRKPTFWFPTWSDTNRAVQPQKMARGLKFRIWKVEGLYYLCSENKGADQLRGYREVDLRLCFRICKTLVFSRRGSYATKGIILGKPAQFDLILFDSLSVCICQNQNQNSLLVKRQNDNTSPGDWPRKISP